MQTMISHLFARRVCRWPNHLLIAASASSSQTKAILQTICGSRLDQCILVQPRHTASGSSWSEPKIQSRFKSTEAEASVPQMGLQNHRMGQYPAMSLHEAAEKGDLADLKTCMDNVWMHVDLPDENMLTPLARAALSLQPDAVKFLIANGADARICMGKGLHKPAEILTSLAQIPKESCIQERFNEHLANNTVTSEDGHKKNKDRDITSTDEVKGDVAQAILAAFPECATAPSGILNKIEHDNGELLKCIEMTRTLSFGQYQSIEGNNHWGQLEFAVDIFFKVNRRISVSGVVAALKETGARAQVVDKSYAQGADDKSVPVFGKIAEWKAVQWSKGEWHLIGVNSPIGRGDDHLDHVSRVFKKLKEIAAVDKLWEVNVGLRKAVGCYSLHHLQSLCVRFAMCESGLRSLLPCPTRSFHEDESVPVMHVWKIVPEARHKAFDDIYNANTYGRLVRLLGDQSLLKLNEVESFGIAQFLSAGGAPNYIDLENWIRTLHWFVGTSELAIPMSNRQNPEDPDDALQFVLTKLVTDPLLVQWAWNRRRIEKTTGYKRQL